jgi:colanic acid/amylovoran biosynthesis glycosyltransferase
MSSGGPRFTVPGGAADERVHGPRPHAEPPDAGLRVAYIMSRFPKLTETFVLYEMLALEEREVAVEIFPLLRHRSAARHPEAARLVPRAHFQPFVSLDILRANWARFRQGPRRYLALWWEMLSGTWRSPNFFFGALGILPKCVLFAREMERLGVHHVHAHFANHPALAALIIHRLTDIPYSFTAHGSDLHVDRRMLETKVRAAAFVVTVSRYNRDLIADECGEDVEEKVKVIHCGVDPEGFPPSRFRHNGRDQALRIVCVASLEEVKGHRFLIEACRLLRKRWVAFECDLVGDGPLRAEVTEAIERAGLENRIRVRGGLPRPEVVRALARAHVAVLASHPTPSGKREGIPVALMEAMASRLPVVASAVSGIPELVENGRTGILVPPADPTALADALERLAADPLLRDWMGAAGREKVQREFDLRQTAGDILSHIMEIRARGNGKRTGKGAA